MAQVPLAFSIHNFIDSVGADAGFAAIIGLAILVLLYFAHARETANLREEAALLTERLMEAEARVTQLTRQGAAAPAEVGPPPAQAAPAPAPRRAGPASLGVVQPFAPAGVAAPALAAATRVVPTERVAASPVAAGAFAAPPITAPGVATPVGAPAARSAVAPAAAGAQIAAPAAATVAGANGAGQDHDVPSQPVTANALRRPLRPGDPGARRPLSPLREPSRTRSRWSRGIAALVGLGLAAGVAAVLVIATSGGSTSSSSTVADRTTNAPSPHHSRTAPAFLPSSVTVAVLNGTNVNQLAHRVAQHLINDGYKQGNVLTAVNQTETTTVVSYFPGAANRAGALHVATSLKLKPSAVQPIDTSTRQVACQGATPCTANVAVTVGSDLATL
jgi:hypothetical protein